MIALLFDTETTGLIENGLRPLIHQAEVIEFYSCMADLRTGEIQDDFEAMIKPRTRMSQETIEKTKTKLSNEMLEGAPSFESLADKIKDIIETAPLVIAHNASFDKEIISIEMQRCGKQVRWPPVVCTIEQTMHLKGFRLSLSNLHLHLFNEEFIDAHRAKADVKALLRCCTELYARGEI